MKVGKFLMEGGWKARERATPAWFAVSWLLLQVARLGFRVAGDNYNLSEVLNHLGIWERLVAGRLLGRAVGRSLHALARCGRRRCAIWPMRWWRLGGISRRYRSFCGHSRALRAAPLLGEIFERTTLWRFCAWAKWPAPRGRSTWRVRS